MKLICLPLLCAAALCAAVMAYAAPTALNLVPTAEVIGKHNLSLQVESDGFPTAFAHGSDLYLLTQFGLRDDLEIGLDIPDLARNDDYSFDAKWQFAAEAGGRPALALGFMNAGVDDSDTVYYLAASRSFEHCATRFTAGLQTAEIRRGFVGVCHSLSDGFDLQADWTTGPEAYATLGLGCALGDRWYLLPYYAWNNTAGGENFMGLNISWQRNFCCGGE